MTNNSAIATEEGSPTEVTSLLGQVRIQDADVGDDDDERYLQSSSLAHRRRSPPSVKIGIVVGLLLMLTVGMVATVGTPLTMDHESSSTTLWGSANTASLDSDSSSSSKKTDIISFPEGFVWGAATSAFQIEGAVKEDGRGPSVWDTFCHDDPEKHCDGFTGDVACDHYHRMEEDVELMKNVVGIHAYRFSISWSRILPAGELVPDAENNGVNQAGIDFYNRLIDALIERNLDPWVTLFHWDLPQALQDKYGGWASKATITAFAQYSRICFEAFGDRVQHWTTINEAWTFSALGYNGIHAPGLYTSATEGYVVGHNILLGHAHVVDMYRTEYKEKYGGVIGITNCADFRYPLDPDSESDRLAAERAILFQLAWFTDPIWGSSGDYPKEMRDIVGDRLPTFTEEERALVQGSSDFFGLNHYSSWLTTEPEVRPPTDGYWTDMKAEFSSLASWPKTDMGWNVVPEGCRDLLLWIANRYGNPEVYMTENGSAFPEEDEAVALNDVKRISYFEGYLAACASAIHDHGVALKGYFTWSLMDNFEWALGFSKRFGIVRVDFDTLERLPKASAYWFRDTIAQNGYTLPVSSAKDTDSSSVMSVTTWKER